jgi:oligoribonuclease (3'-5' exoribonuclease)
MLDVSTVKLLAAGMMGVSVKKQESHHALDDIEESIDELRFLLNRMGNVDMRNYLIE